MNEMIKRLMTVIIDRQLKTDTRHFVLHLKSEFEFPAFVLPKREIQKNVDFSLGPREIMRAGECNL